jgi:conjugal transfer pilus assembly protein TraD
MSALEHGLKTLLLIATVIVGGGIATATLLRTRGLMWTWAMLGLPIALALMAGNAFIGFAVGAGSLLACWLGARWHHEDRHHGGDLGEAASRRVGMLAAIARIRRRWANTRARWLRDGRLVVGRDEKQLPVSIPVGHDSGSHALVVGATGSGKTVSEAWIATRHIEGGHGAIVIDPKGDRLLRDELETAAARTGVAFLEWTPEGPLPYNPYARGGDTEIADKALAGERFTEPHYLRQAQRYLGHAVRTMRAAQIPLTPASLMAHLDVGQLEVSARALPEGEAAVVEGYLDSLGERQRRELAGVRDRLSILAESDARQWLEPADGGEALDLKRALTARSVVYFRLDSDRRVLLSQMIAAAIVSDLVTLVGELQSHPIATVVLIDEFSAVAAEHVARLFARARSAGISLILGTQELGDLKATAEWLREQVLANVSTVIAHRQSVPESAELIAAMAGTRPAWITTQQTEEGLLAPGPSGRGSRRRGYEYEIHPSQIKALPTGWAVVLTPGSGQRPAIAHMHQPSEAQR